MGLKFLGVAALAASTTPVFAFIAPIQQSATLLEPQVFGRDAQLRGTPNQFAVENPSGSEKQASWGGTAAGVAFLCAAAVAGVRAQGRRRDCPSGRKVVSVVAAAANKDMEGKLTAEQVSALTNSVPLKFDNVDIAKVLPHRYPFLLVDKIVDFEAGKRAVGVKNVTANEPQFTGHFPDRPIMPGVLMVEAMAQLGGLVCLQQPVSDGKGEFFFAAIDGIKFRRPVVPGDTLVMEMELKKWRPKYGIAKMTGKAYVDGEIALEVNEFTFALVQ